jgi:DNA polymerase-3 subunit beta
VHITAGSAEYTLHTYNPEDFPRLPELDAVPTFAVDRESLLETIHRVARAASRDESRPVLTGILVSFTDGKLVMAATDSYRLAVKETELDGSAPELEAIVPSRALQELARIASHGAPVVRFRSSPGSPARETPSRSAYTRTRCSSRSTASG